MIADVVKSIYDKAGIELVTNQEIVEMNDREVVTKSGERYRYDLLAMLEPIGSVIHKGRWIRC